MFIGNPATLGRVLAYLNGFEMALSMACGHQPQLNEFSDLLKELHMLGNDVAEGITENSRPSERRGRSWGSCTRWRRAR